MSESKLKDIRDLKCEREALLEKQKNHKRAIKEEEEKIQEINKQIRNLRISSDGDANSRLTFEIDVARMNLQKMCDEVLGEGAALVNISLSIMTKDAKFKSYDF